jgi:hypothetical protein
MGAADVNNAANVTQAVVSAKDVNADGATDKIAIREESAGVVKTGIYNINTPEGRAAAKAALLDLGLAMPEFLSAAGENYIQRLPQNQRVELDQIAQIASGSTQGTGANSGTVTANLQGRWAEFMGKIATSGGVDVNVLVQFVLREAYMENTKDLHFYAQKVRFYNDLKKGIREELTRARKALSDQAQGCADWAKTEEKDVENAPVSYRGKEFLSTPDYNPAGGMMPKPATEMGENEIATKGQLEAYIEGLEEQLSSVGDDAQLANVDLQNMLQKQQQTLLMMSNISKMLHDTAMAIIRKMGS